MYSHDAYDGLEEKPDKSGKIPLQYFSANTNLSSIKALSSIEHEDIDGCVVSNKFSLMQTLAHCSHQLPPYTYSL